MVGRDDQRGIRNWRIIPSALGFWTVPSLVDGLAENSFRQRTVVWRRQRVSRRAGYWRIWQWGVIPVPVCFSHLLHRRLEGAQFASPHARLYLALRVVSQEIQSAHSNDDLMNDLLLEHPPERPGEHLHGPGGVGIEARMRTVVLPGVEDSYTCEEIDDGMTGGAADGWVQGEEEGAEDGRECLYGYKCERRDRVTPEELAVLREIVSCGSRGGVWTYCVEPPYDGHELRDESFLYCFVCESPQDNSDGG
jgi:hypothetical protein